MVDDGQGADSSSPHQIGGLPERRGGSGSHDIGGHQITNGAVDFGCRSSCAAKVALGDDTHQSSVIHHDEMADAVLAHLHPRRARALVSFNRDYFNAHDVSDSHVAPPGNRRARTGQHAGATVMGAKSTDADRGVSQNSPVL
ncbi:MAG: hypothetical protein ABI885_28915 [Gammaproteobacteria bacterium]